MNSQILLGYGTYKIEDISVSEMKELLWTAFKSGYDYIDTASYYKNEAIIGQALTELRAEKGSSFNFPVQTKLWTEDFIKARKVILESRKLLNLDVIHSVLLHRPSTNLAKDIAAWKVLIELQKEGIIGEIGVSNYDYEMIHYLEKATGVKPEYNQIEFSIFNSRFDRYVSNLKKNIEIQAWRPLTNDLEKLSEEPVVQKLMQKYNTSASGIALGYLKFFKISPIVKSSKKNHIIENAKAFFSINLSLEDVKELRALNHYLIAGSATLPFFETLDQKFLSEIDLYTKKANE